MGDFAGQRNVDEILHGHRLSRRDFLRASALAGIAVAGTATAASLPRTTQPQSNTGAVTPPPTLTASDVAARLSNDPEAIFRFVSERVGYHPYSGALRGARGVWATRAGNSVDQADLLAVLLQAAGISTRYVFGEIDQATVDRIMASTVVDPETAGADMLEALSGRLPDEPAGDRPALGPDQQAQLDAARAKSAPVSSWIEDQLEATLGAIESALVASGETLPAGFTEFPEREARQHAWVQAALDGSQWVDLDPTVPGTVMGEAVGQPTETLDAIPDELYHYIDLAVKGETRENDALSSSELLSFAGRASEWTGQPIMVFAVGSEALPALASGFNAINGVQMYRPVLAIGDRSYAGEPMQFSEGGDDGGGLGGGFFDAGDAAPETTAAWLVATVRGPDREPETVERVIFDRFGAEARLGDGPDPAALPELQMIDLGGDDGPQAEPAQSVAWLSVSTGTPSQTADILALEGDDPTVAASFPFAHQLADDLLGSMTLPALGVRSFVAAPNVTAFSGHTTVDPSGVPTMRTALDILHRNRGTMAVDGVDAQASPAALTSIAAHTAERLVLGDAERALSPEEAPESVSVGRVFERAAEEGIEIGSFTSPEQVADLPVAPSALARLQERLAAGWVAVTPLAPVAIGAEQRTGWWLYQPATGRFMDEMDDGRGSMAEDIIVRAKAIATAMVTRCLGLLLALGLGIITTILILYFAADLGAQGSIGGSVYEGFLSVLAGNTMWKAGELLIECAV